MPRRAAIQWAAVSDARAGRQARTVDLRVTGRVPKILDLETGKQLDFPRAEGEKQAMEAVGRMASGDLVYTGRSGRIVCVRGATSDPRLLSCDHGPDTREYKFPKPVASSLVVRTRKGEEFCVTMIHAGPGGCRLAYFPVTHAEAEAIAQEAAVAAGKADRHAATSAPKSAREERPRQQLGTLEVFVSDSTYGRPIVGAAVPLSHLGTAPRRKLTTDRDGLAVASLAPGRWHVSPTRHVDHPADRKFRNITIVAGETCRLEVKLEQLPVVEGVVLDPAGLPMSGAVVRLMPNGTRAVQSGADGEFEVTLNSKRHSGVLDDPCMLVVRHLKRGLATAISLGLGRDVERGAAPATVTLHKGVSIAGRVTDSAGQPLSRVKVFAYLQMPEVASSIERAAFTGGDGRYEIDAVPVGQTYYVSTLGPKGYGTRRSAKVVLTRADPEQIEVPDLVLLRADAEVSGSVLDSMGRPVAGAQVYVSGEGQPHEEVTADALGRFAFSLCPGQARISASWRAGSTRERIVAPAENLKLVIRSAR